eukprot:CAMPEP_0178406984 /NCGR_PEP_ID=MMETSP0689_2-20121128/19194_1 /TAXON_ID=160604 /ORGANISM="Amphidinium massartii, Strain CS-259" /LENGTH=117 /DNA_ID=CAMNT_0020028043 /DNA_START=181 /DNA_END=534 /DNA_ORIENTATION=+
MTSFHNGSHCQQLTGFGVAAFLADDMPYFRPLSDLACPGNGSTIGPALRAYRDAACLYEYENITDVEFADCEDYLTGSDLKTVHEKYRVQCGSAAPLKGAFFSMAAALAALLISSLH